MRQIIVILVLITCVAAQGEPDRKLELGVAVGAVETFKVALDERWSYRHANSADFDAGIVALRKRIDRGITKDELGIELQKILALGIDGHASVSGYSFPSGGRLPFLIEVAGERFVAIDPQRKSFLADGFPFLMEIDEHAIAEWCKAASTLVMKGSPQYIRHRCLNQLRELDYWRQMMKIPRTNTVKVELTDAAGKARKSLTLPVDTKLNSYGVWPAGGSRLLSGNIGYLRLASMSTSSSIPEIDTWMPKFRDTIGLIVDVRDNNGGDRDPLMLLYSYLAAPEDPPRVFNAAAYRLHKDRPENYLAKNHRMFRANSTEWSDSERRSVAEFAGKFEPKWKLPHGQFSEWHYMALKRLDKPGLYYYDKPVIVLLNNKCFSATDIFLAGLKGMKNVLLLGMPSSGGSAFTQEIPLGETELTLRIGSMASFQSNGKLFDGNGINPEILVEPVPEYYIGGRDNVLEEAMRRIRERQ